MSDSINHIDSPAKKKNIKKQLILKLSAALCTIAVLAGTGYTIYFLDNQQRDRQLTQTAVRQITVPDIPQPVIDPADYDPNKPIYENDRTFTVNLSRFSENNHKSLQRNIQANYVALYDATADEFVYEKNAAQKCYPASTTKLLTAIVATKIITDPDTVITVGNEIEMIGEESSTAGLEKGMKLTFADLMDAMMLPSGNDAAYTMAVNCARIYKDDPKLSNQEAVAVFVELMNDAARQIGATNSHFVNPDGWHDNNHYTTAEDLAKISIYARNIPLIAKSCKTHYAERQLIKGGMIYWVNTNLMLNDFYGCYSPYCDGLKTGYTDEAGSSVIASATIDGHIFIAVVMDGFDGYSKYDDANLLLKRGFRIYKLDYTYGLPKIDTE